MLTEGRKRLLSFALKSAHSSCKQETGVLCSERLGKGEKKIKSSEGSKVSSRDK